MRDHLAEFARIWRVFDEMAMVINALTDAVGKEKVSEIVKAAYLEAEKKPKGKPRCEKCGNDHTTTVDIMVHLMNERGDEPDLKAAPNN